MHKIVVVAANTLILAYVLLWIYASCVSDDQSPERWAIRILGMTTLTLLLLDNIVHTLIDRDD